MGHNMQALAEQCKAVPSATAAGTGTGAGTATGTKVSATRTGTGTATARSTVGATSGAFKIEFDVGICLGTFFALACTLNSFF